MNPMLTRWFAVVCLASTANAALVTFEFSAKVSSISVVGASSLGDNFATGDLITFSYTFDSTVAATINPVFPFEATYVNAVKDFSVTAGGQTFTPSGLFVGADIVIRNNQIMDASSMDLYAFSTLNVSPEPLEGHYLTNFTVNLNSTERGPATPLSSLDLPLDPSALLNFENENVTLRFDAGDQSGHTGVIAKLQATSSVPEGGSSVVMLVGALVAFLPFALRRSGGRWRPIR